MRNKDREFHARTRLLIRTSRQEFTGIKKSRRTGKVVLFTYLWYFDGSTDTYKFERWTISRNNSTIEVMQYPTLTMLIHGIKAHLNLKDFHPGIKRKGVADPRWPKR